MKKTPFFRFFIGFLFLSLPLFYPAWIHAQETEAELAEPTLPTPGYWRFQFFLKMNAATFSRKMQSHLPPNGATQEVLSLRRYSPDFTYEEIYQDFNQQGIWTSKEKLHDTSWIIYDMTLRTYPQIKPKKLLPAKTPPLETAFYHPKEADFRLLDEKMVQLGLKDKTISKKVRILFDYVANAVESDDTGQNLNIAKILENNKGNISDKNSLFMAFLARLEIPVRRVNGITLKDRKIKKNTHQWVQAYFEGGWLNFDFNHGFFARLEADHFILHYGEEPLFKSSAGVTTEPHFVVSKMSEENALDPGDLVIPQKDLLDDDDYFKSSGKKESDVSNAIGSIAFITEEPIDDNIIEKVSKQAADSQTKITFYSAPYESHFFRGTYIAKILTQNFESLQKSDAIFIQSEDDAGLYALFRMAQNNKKLKNTTVFLNGKFSRPVQDILGYTLYKLIKPKDFFISREDMSVERAWDVVQEHIIDGQPLSEVSARWNIPFQDISTQKMDYLPAWRQFLIRTWILAAKAEVNLESIYLILILPIIALVIVVFRNIIGLETFGTFSPILVSVAFLTTGIFWGVLIFGTIVATGVLFRFLFKKIHIHLVARMAMLIAVVGMTMLAIIMIGVHWGWGALVNVSILPMVIMAGLVENFTKTQMELGTRSALRLTVYTLMVSVVSYYIIDAAGIQSLVLVFPEVVLVAILLEIFIGRWNGIRLNEYFRFYKITGPGLSTKIPSEPKLERKVS